ncbi:MAG: ABC transporter permease [Fimbriimonas sp.]|nr:ABC transporter permease [Fimbriimonas sp.]
MVHRLAALREAGTVVLLAGVVVAAMAKNPQFLDVKNLNSILLWIPLLVVVGMGQMLVILTRGIDVSVGSTMGVAGIVVGMLFRDHPGLNIYLGAAIGMAIGFVLGAINGGLIAWAKIPPIIATLGTLSAYRGLAFIACKGEQIDSNNIPDGLTNWALFGPITINGVTISWLIVWAAAAAILTAYFLRWTRTGRDVYAIGSHPEAAQLRGLPVTKVTFLVYSVCGALAGLAGVLYASRYGFVNPGTAGQGFELTVIAAVVIGGTNVLGGSGTVFGVLLGCLLLGTINVALAVLGIDAAWQTLVYGIVILIALTIDSYLQRLLRRLAVGA